MKYIEDIMDIHCHMLPHVDDGADTYKMARKMLRRASRQGVTKIILTPHYRIDYFETSMEKIKEEFYKMQRMILKMNLDMEVYLGCEYHCHNSMVKRLKNGERPTLAGSSYVLVEFSSSHNFRTIRNQVYELIVAGFKPVLAHIERYPCLFEDKTLELVEEIVNLGGYIQINANSVLGKSGWKVKKFCRRLMEEDLVSFIASDSHDDVYRIPNLGECADYVEKKMGYDYAKRIFVKNPRKIIDDIKTNERKK